MSNSVFTGPPQATGTPITTIASLDELLSSHAALGAQEKADTALLQDLVSINREKIRTSLFAWASNGFPNIYVILSIQLQVPPTCSDGVSRTCYQYIEWLTKSKLPTLISGIQSRMTDIEVSYTITGSTFRLHASRTR